MKDGKYRTICTLCHCGCGIIVNIKDGKMQSVLPDKSHPSNRNYLCSKVLSIEELSLSSDRLHMPLKRIGDDFAEISWEEAFNLAASKLSDIIAKFGTGSIMRCSGAPVSYGARDGYSYLMKSMGTANATGSSTYCMVPRVTAFMNCIGGKPEPDFDNADYIIMWGSNPKATNRMGGFCAFNGVQDVLERARKRGSRIVFIDPVKNESIRGDDVWVKIRPGSDVILGLGMLRVIINENLYNHEFVENYTVGFDALSKHVQPYTPEYVEKMTKVDASLLCRIARDFAMAKTATICEGNGLDMYCNTVYAVQTVADLCGITGRIDEKGGLVFLPFVPQSPMNNLNPADMKLKYKYPLFRDIPFPAVKESLLTDSPDKPHAMIVHHANPALINSGSQRTYEALRKLDFLIVSDIFMTATAKAADLILPDKTAFETYGYKCYTSFDKPFAAFQQPVFDCPEDVKSSFEIEFEIAKRMGLDGMYPFHDEISWIDYELKPSGITFDDLKEKGIIFFDKPIIYEKYKDKGFKTPSQKMELYSEKLKSLGYSPMPIEIPGNPELSDDNPDYPYIVINYRPRHFVHTKLHNLETATRLHPQPYVWMNRKILEKNCLNEYDKVKVESKSGSQVFTALLKDDLDDNELMLEFGWGNPLDSKADINRLTDDNCFDPISGGTPNRVFNARLIKA